VGVGELDATPPRGRTSFLADPTGDAVQVDPEEGDSAAGGEPAGDGESAGEPAAAEDPAATDEAVRDDSGETRRRRGLRRLLALR
jgi:hypothetical protein